jgi:hypothetical protein
MIFLRKCLFGLKTLLVVAIFALLGACGDDPPLEVSLETEQEPSDCIDGGRLAVEAFGALNSDIDWRDASIRCEGMQRPQGKGARLRFSGEIEFAGNAWPLAFILSIPDLERGATADELATRVTLIEEENSRFFSTRETDICWSNVTEQTPLKDSAGTVIEHYYRISGLTYCVAPIAELNGAASITLSDLKFTGQLHWARKKQ